MRRDLSRGPKSRANSDCGHLSSFGVRWETHSGPVVPGRHDCPARDGCPSQVLPLQVDLRRRGIPLAVRGSPFLLGRRAFRWARAVTGKRKFGVIVVRGVVFSSDSRERAGALGSLSEKMGFHMTFTAGCRRMIVFEQANAFWGSMVAENSDLGQWVFGISPCFRLQTGGPPSVGPTMMTICFSLRAPRCSGNLLTNGSCACWRRKPIVRISPKSSRAVCWRRPNLLTARARRWEIPSYRIRPRTAEARRSGAAR